MNTLLIELKKCKRSGVILTMLVMGVIGALYGVTYFILRKDSLLSLSVPPMVVLLSQVYGLIMVINMFAVIVATCIIYNIEHGGNAIKKMYMLPIKVTNIYASKFLIIIVLLFICIVIQNMAMGGIGIKSLEAGTFEPMKLLSFTLNSFITSLPVMSLMLFVSSRCENMWITLGVGVAGFFSGITMALSNSKLFLINPFVLMMNPAVSQSIDINFTIITLSIIFTLVFFGVGIFTAKYISYE